MQFTPAELSILRQAAEIILRSYGPERPPARKFQDKRLTSKDAGEFGITRPANPQLTCNCNVPPWEDCVCIKAGKKYF